MKLRRVGLTLAAVLGFALLSPVAVPAQAAGPSGPDILNVGHSMTSGQAMMSTNGWFELKLYGGIQCVLQEPQGTAVGLSGAPATWCGGSSTLPPDPTRLIMQGDGNLVLYDASSRALWSSRTFGTGSQNYAVMQGDGNLVVRTAAGTPVWASGSGATTLWPGQRLATGQRINVLADTWQPPGVPGSPSAHLVMQGDGNLVWYGAHGQPLWSSRTYGTGTHNYAVMQGDGNFVVYTSSGRAAWASHTRGSNATILTVGGQVMEISDLRVVSPLWVVRGQR